MGKFILSIPIIGDIFYVFVVGSVAFLVFGFILLPIENLTQRFLKTSIIFTGINDDDAFKVLTNSYPVNIWLCLLIAFNYLAIRYSFKNSEDIVFILILWIIGLIPGLIAYKKGRNFYNWWMYGHLLFIVAFPHALLLRETDNSLINRGILKNCPYCAEVVKKEAKVCKHRPDFCICFLWPSKPCKRMVEWQSV